MKKLVVVDWDNCPECGDAPEISTDSRNPEGEFNDSDDVKCCDCGLVGSVVLGCPSGIYIEWSEQEER